MCGHYAIYKEVNTMKLTHAYGPSNPNVIGGLHITILYLEVIQLGKK